MPHPLLIFSQSDYLIQVVIQINILNDKQCRSRSVGFLIRSQLIWIFTVCKGRTYPGSAGQDLINCIFPKYWDRQERANSIVPDQMLQNSVDPDQMLQNAASDQGLHCLPIFQHFLDTCSNFRTSMVRS